MWKILRNFSKKRENHKDDSFKEKIMSCRNQEISMDAVMNNLFLSKRLYDLLKVKCHPDRFIEPTQKEIATGIYQNITKYKTDYQQLLNIKEQVTHVRGTADPFRQDIAGSDKSYPFHYGKMKSFRRSYCFCYLFIS